MGEGVTQLLPTAEYHAFLAVVVIRMSHRCDADVCWHSMVGIAVQTAMMMLLPMLLLLLLLLPLLPTHVSLCGSNPSV